MKKVFKFLLLIALPLLFAACNDKTEDVINIAGEWQYYDTFTEISYENGVVINREEIEVELLDSDGRFVLYEDGSFIGDGLFLPYVGSWKYMESSKTLTLTWIDYDSEMHNFTVTSLTQTEMTLTWKGGEFYREYDDLNTVCTLKFIR